MSTNEVLDTVQTKRDWFAFCFAWIFPTVITIVYFQVLDGTAPWLQQSAYAVGKLLQFGFPVAWIYYFYRGHLKRGDQRPEEERPTETPRDLMFGVGFGVLVVVFLFVFYAWLIGPTDLGDRLKTMVSGKVNSMGLNTFWKYFAVGCFYTVCHSFLEEYYWRWFVFWLGKKKMSVVTANVVSSIGFAAHHVILLGFFLGWESIYTYVIAVFIAIGGSFWAWLFHRTNRLRAAWLSHGIVDAGIFAFGYWLTNIQ